MKELRYSSEEEQLDIEMHFYAGCSFFRNCTMSFLFLQIGRRHTLLFIKGKNTFYNFNSLFGGMGEFTDKGLLHCIYHKSLSLILGGYEARFLWVEVHRNWLVSSQEHCITNPQVSLVFSPFRVLDKS